jgi:hypothetical protein
MSEHSGQGTDGEGDFFDRWLAQRDVEEHPGDQPRSSTVPPKWAPKVVAPPPDPVAPPEPEEPPLAWEEPPPPPVAPPYVPAAAHVATPVAAPTVAPAAVAPGAIAASTAPAPTMAPPPPPPPPPPPSAPPPPPPPPAPVYDSVEDLAPTSVLSRVPEPREPAPRHAEPLAGPPARPSGRTTTEAAPKTKAEKTEKTEDTPPPIRHTFAPRTRARMAVGIGTLLAAIASVIGCYIAAREKDLPSIGIAVTLWVLTGIIWAVHSGTSVTRLSVRGGQLQVIRHGVRTTIDLTSSYTPVEVYGRPGKHGWKVIFRRRDMSAFVIDQSMVDPAEFMRVLRYYRPGVDAETK